MIECVEWGGCGIFVWSVYGLSLLTFVVVGSWPIFDLVRTRKQIGQQLFLDSLDERRSSE